jgi:hypothetical protein
MTIVSVFLLILLSSVPVCYSVIGPSLYFSVICLCCLVVSSSVIGSCPCSSVIGPRLCSLFVSSSVIGPCHCSSVIGWRFCSFVGSSSVIGSRLYFSVISLRASVIGPRLYFSVINPCLRCFVVSSSVIGPCLCSLVVSCSSVIGWRCLFFCNQSWCFCDRCSSLFFCY